MSFRFDETQRGRKFYDSDIPKLVKALSGIHEELKRANDLKELELKNKGVMVNEKD